MRSKTPTRIVPSQSEQLRIWLDENSSDHETWSQAQAVLDEIAASAGAAGLRELEECMTRFATLLEIVATQTPLGSAPENELREILSFVHLAAPSAVTAVEQDLTPDPAFAQLIEEAQTRWGDSLQLFGSPQENLANDVEQLQELLDSEASSADDVDLATALENNAEQIDLLLSAIGEFEPVAVDAGRETPPSNTVVGESLKLTPELDALSEMFADVDLRDAFLQDASRCLSAIELTVLESESNPRQGDHHRQICRELHTLKGASASVGLSELANYLHSVEATVEHHSQAGAPLDCDQMLGVVDTVRRHIAPPDNTHPPLAQHSPERGDAKPAEPALSSAALLPETTNGEPPSSVRVRSSKLDRLMDMLAELVVLRNRRETQISELNLLNQELSQCALRLKQFSDQLCDYSKALPMAEGKSTAAEFGSGYLGLELASSKAIGEVASDLNEISRGIRDFYRPIGEENVSLTHFIRQFRQEMMQLRRLPVSGLFQRLQRAARDAARAESKQVQIQFLGHQTAIEQSLQEQLYDPLLHIVRNAVSHGIEDSASRTARGKSPVGQLTLQISASANLLGVDVSDDGRGLDYDALRRRGYECGLLSPDRLPTHQELAKLIFHPGFSTRDSASEIAGRGVGMDVVATAIDRLHGRIEIDSAPGKGTTIRLSIPLRSGIEHAMVFRSGGQLFAVPMHSVSSVQNSAAPASSPDGNRNPSLERPCVSFARLAGSPISENQANPQLLVLDLDSGNCGARVRVNLLVDEIVGGEEVVVRALPRSLKQHPFVGGVTLSGGGAIVLTIDPTRLGEICRPRLHESVGLQPMPSATLGPTVAPKKVLVVDDSLSARMSLVKRLNRHGLDVVQASDGLQALECLRRDSFQLVMTDLDMPRLGGLELLGEIRQRRLLDTPVVVVSSRTEEILRNRAKRYGAEAYLNKPVTDESLTDLLEQLSLIAL